MEEPGAFFFSSRRRHTRCSRDWSSDVCSSDLLLAGLAGPSSRSKRRRRFCVRIRNGSAFWSRGSIRQTAGGAGKEIGRAACRERVEISVGAVSLKKKKKECHCTVERHADQSYG